MMTSHRYKIRSTAKRPYVFLCVLFLLAAAWSCGKKGVQPLKTGTGITIPEAPHQKLSDYSLYQGEMKNLAPRQVSGLLPYDLNTQLFSDYAQKLRLVYVPEGTSAIYSEDEAFDFPVGSVIVKNFFYAHDLREPSAGRKIIETRLLMHKAEGWTAETYVWNKEQTEAFRQIAGSTETVSWTDERGTLRTARYVIPTKNDCKSCHSLDGKIVPLGPKARNLNKTYPYADGPANQLIRWQQAGILQDSPKPEDAPRVPVWDDPSTGSTEQRARAYLDVNCANCHNPGGSANNSGLYLEYHQQDPAKLGVCRMPVSAGKGSGGLKYDIVPGQPDSSILAYRMEATDPEIRMPEVGRTLVDDKAVELIRKWIENMDASGCQ